MAGVDVSGVIALTNAAVDAALSNRDARAAELYGRAVVAAQALQQPDCAIVAFLQVYQAQRIALHAEMPGVPPAEAANLWRTALSELLPAAFATVQRRIAAGTLSPGACCAHEEAWYGALMHRANGPGGEPALHAEPTFTQLVGYDLRIEVSRLLLVRLSKTSQLPLAARMQAGAVRADCLFIARTFDMMAERRFLPDIWIASEMVLIHPFSGVEQPFDRLVFPDVHAREEMMRVFRRLETCTRMQQPRARALLIACAEDAYANNRAADAVARSPAMRVCALSGCGARETHVSQFKLCGACKTVCYCSKAHQTEDWAHHKAACKAARNAAAAATARNDGAASGAA
jgi:hypothetical protein